MYVYVFYILNIVTWYLWANEIYFLIYLNYGMLNSQAHFKNVPSFEIFHQKARDATQESTESVED